MAKIDFKYFRIPTGIDRSRYQTGDARESVANMLYLNVNGIRAHALAMKIYQSEVKLINTEDEVRTLIEVSNTYGTPAFIDGLKIQLDNKSEIG